jgi:hypothetical protein
MRKSKDQRVLFQGTLIIHGSFYYVTTFIIIFNPSMTLGVKFQILPWTKLFEIHNTLKFTHDHTVHRDQQHVK